MELDRFHHGARPGRPPSFWEGAWLHGSMLAGFLVIHQVSHVHKGLKSSPCVPCEDKEDASMACPYKVCVAPNYGDAHQPSPQETQACACPVPTWTEASSSASLAGGLERQSHRKLLQNSCKPLSSTLQAEKGSIALEQCCQNLCLCGEHRSISTCKPLNRFWAKFWALPLFEFTLSCKADLALMRTPTPFHPKPLCRAQMK